LTRFFEPCCLFNIHFQNVSKATSNSYILARKGWHRWT
jgi:hypothetical protein